MADRALAAPEPHTRGPCAYDASFPPCGQELSGSANTRLPSVYAALHDSGRPLDPALRREMGQRFGYDFSGVRLHSGPAAEQSARDLKAKAYNAGQHIVFGAGEASLDAARGKRLLAHELAHVVQQGTTPISSTPPTISRFTDPDADLNTPQRTNDSRRAVPVAPSAAPPFPDVGFDVGKLRVAGLANLQRLEAAWEAMATDPARARLLLNELLAVESFGSGIAGLALQPAVPDEALPLLRMRVQDIEDILDATQAVGASNQSLWSDSSPFFIEAAHAIWELDLRRPQPLEVTSGDEEHWLVVAYRQKFPDEPAPSSLDTNQRMKLSIAIAGVTLAEAARESLWKLIHDPWAWGVLVASIAVYAAAWLSPTLVTQLAAAGLTAWLLLSFGMTDIIGFGVAWSRFSVACDRATDTDSLAAAGTEFVNTAGGIIVDILLLAATWLLGKVATKAFGSTPTSAAGTGSGGGNTPNVRLVIGQDGWFTWKEVSTGRKLAILDENYQVQWMDEALAGQLVERLPARSDPPPAADASWLLPPEALEEPPSRRPQAGSASAAGPQGEGLQTLLRDLQSAASDARYKGSEALQFVHAAFPDLPLFLAEVTETFGIRASMSFVEVKNGRAAILICPAEIDAYTIRHEIGHVLDFVEGRLAPDYSLPHLTADNVGEGLQSLDHTNSKTLGEGLHEWEIQGGAPSPVTGETATLHALLPEFVNYARDLGRWGSSVQAATLEGVMGDEHSPAQSMVANAVGLGSWIKGDPTTRAPLCESWLRERWSDLDDVFREAFRRLPQKDRNQLSKDPASWFMQEFYKIYPDLKTDTPPLPPNFGG